MLSDQAPPLIVTPSHEISTICGRRLVHVGPLPSRQYDLCICSFPTQNCLTTIVAFIPGLTEVCYGWWERGQTLVLREPFGGLTAFVDLSCAIFCATVIRLK